MSKKISIILLGLFILPLLAGIMNVDAGCCDDLFPTSTVSTTENPLIPDGTVPMEQTCFDCCQTCYGKTVLTHNSYLVTPTPSFVTSSFDYSFSRKSSFISTPDKPPRT